MSAVWNDKYKYKYIYIYEDFYFCNLFTCIFLKTECLCARAPFILFFFLSDEAKICDEWSK